jgi:hypothetical protein
VSLLEVHPVEGVLGSGDRTDRLLANGRHGLDS